MPFILLLLLVVGVLIAAIEIGIIQYAYEKIGIDSRYLSAAVQARSNYYAFHRAHHGKLLNNPYSISLAAANQIVGYMMLEYSV